MRELKFRAYDKRFNVMLSHVMPYQPSIVLSDVSFNDCYGDKADDRSETGVDDGGPEHYCITDEEIEIMQFINKQDKNGTDVYDLDIIKINWLTCESTIETISYDEKYGYWKYGNNPICELEDPYTEFEVIGNYYQIS